MSRKILLIEPNYKNKYPPMGLMKMATYFRNRGDDVRFFKGDLIQLVIELDVDDTLERLSNYDAKINWKRYKKTLMDYFRLGRNSILEECEELENDIFALEIVKDARKSFKAKDYFENPRFDFVGITTLFTFFFDITVETINFAKLLCKDQERVMVGGIMASIIPDEVYKATGIHPFVGQLDCPGAIDPDDDQVIDRLPLDYSILEEVDYKYPANNAYYAYMTRGCINHCAFCAVPTLEPNYYDYIGIKEQIEADSIRFGDKRDLLLLDNNVLASKSFERIIDEIKAAGFGKNAKYLPPNEYAIAINNLRSNYNNRAYIKKTILLYKALINKLPEELAGEFYGILEKHDLLEPYSASRENILAIDEYVAPLYEKYIMRKKNKPLVRYVDFNQGMDSRLITDANMQKLAEINIRPLRIAFDHWELREIYEKSVRCAVNAGITHLSNYLLYNFKDKPEHLYYRLKMNVQLCDELGADIYSFPMKYHPINDPDYYMNRDYIGEHWNRKFIRAVQAILNSTKGAIGRGYTFFCEAFGEDEHRFNTILWMPEAFIIYRMKFKDNLAKEWERKFWGLNDHDLLVVQELVGKNSFKDIRLDDYSPEIQEVLQYYYINRDTAAKMIVDEEVL